MKQLKIFLYTGLNDLNSLKNWLKSYKKLQNNKESDVLHFTCHEKSARSIGCRSDMLTTHISIDQNNHSYIL